MYFECFSPELFLTVVVLTSTFKYKNSLRTIDAQIVQKLKNNEARPKFTGCYKKACAVVCQFGHVFFLMWQKNTTSGTNSARISVVKISKSYIILL